MTRSQENAENVQLFELQHELDVAGDDWLPLLAAFLPVGLADSQQLQKAAGLSRHQLDRRIDAFNRLENGIVERVNEKLRRPTGKGRPPVIYRLGRWGAGLLRKNGHPEAQPSGLTDPTAISHALAMVDIRRAAEAEKRLVSTDRVLKFGDDREIRPDNLVTLPDGKRALFESEQSLTYSTLQRAVRSAQNRQALFMSDAAKGISPHVRVVFNLSRGQAWDRTMNLWEKALAIVADKQQGGLPFEMWAMPHADFVNKPDWSEPPDPSRWQRMLNPGLMASFAEPTPEGKGALVKSARRSGQLAELPGSLRRPSTRESYLLLRALLQEFDLQAPQTNDQLQPVVFFELMELIYTASHDEGDPALTGRLPEASLYLLKRYLNLHPDLRTALNKALSRNRHSLKYSLPVILHEMQNVIDTLLRYHGLETGWRLRIVPGVSDFKEIERQTFSVRVRIWPELLMRPDDEIIPGEERLDSVHTAIAWVIWALFSYSDRLGLERPAYW